MTNHKFKNSIIVALMMTPNKKGPPFFEKNMFFSRHTTGCYSLRTF
jgi:hypothetical protein